MGKEQAERGKQLMREVAGVDVPVEGGTPFSVAARDFVFGEVWGRPGLDLRSRLWITLSSVVAAGAPGPVKIYARSAVESGLITTDEMHEFVLHVAMYQGFPKATVIQAALSEVEAEMKAGGPS